MDKFETLLVRYMRPKTAWTAVIVVSLLVAVESLEKGLWCFLLFAAFLFFYGHFVGWDVKKPALSPSDAANDNDSTNL